MSFIFSGEPLPSSVIYHNTEEGKIINPYPGIKGVFSMKMSELVAKTNEFKVLEKIYACKIILSILEDQDNIKWAEIFPGSILGLTLDRGHCDRIEQMIKNTGNYVLELDSSQIWRCSGQDVISIRFDKLDDIDTLWDQFIDDLKNKAEKT